MNSNNALAVTGHLAGAGIQLCRGGKRLRACCSPSQRSARLTESRQVSLNLVVEDQVMQRLRDQLDQAGLPVFALAQSRPSLDDVYLRPRPP